MEIVATTSLTFIQSLISFLPEGGTFPQELHDSAVILGGYFATVNAFLPVDTAIACFTLVYSVTIASWVFRLLVRAVYFVRGTEYNPRPL